MTTRSPLSADEQAAAILRIEDIEATLAWHLEMDADATAALDAAGASVLNQSAAVAFAPFAPTSAMVIAAEVKRAVAPQAHILVLEPDPVIAMGLDHFELNVTSACIDARTRNYRETSDKIVDAPLSEAWPEGHHNKYDAVLVDLLGCTERLTPVLARAVASAKDDAPVFVIAHPGQRKMLRAQHEWAGYTVGRHHRERLGRLLRGGWMDFSLWDLWTLVRPGDANAAALKPLSQRAQRENDDMTDHHGIIDVTDVLCAEVTDEQMKACMRDAAKTLGVSFVEGPVVRHEPLTSCYAVLSDRTHATLSLHAQAGVATLAIFPAPVLTAYAFVDGVIAHIPRRVDRRGFRPAREGGSAS